MRLEPAERKAILAGGRPSIIRTADRCPFELGDVIALRSLRSLDGPIPQVAITIVGWRRGKKGEWIARYSIRDDRPLYLGKGLRYTRVRSESIDPEADVLDPKALKRFAEEGHLKTMLRGAFQRHQQEKLADEAELAKQRRRGKAGVLLEAKIRRVERRLDSAA